MTGGAAAPGSDFARFGRGHHGRICDVTWAAVSSGRSPARTACAYTSWGGFDPRNWPLFPARDVVVPHTRTMPDMLRILDVLVQDDPITRGTLRRQEAPRCLASSRRPPSARAH